MNLSEIIQNMLDSVIPWLFGHGLKIAVIVIIALIINKFGGIFIEKAVRRAVAPNHFLSEQAEKKREDTLIKIFSATIRVLVWLLAIMMSLQEAGIEIGPLLAAAGIAGLAFGFGGQYLIRDLIGGLFIIIENQYRVGDVVSFDSVSGVVEDITLRMTTLRDMDGTVHHIPHGEVKTVSNLSKHFARINMNIGISYNADLEKVISVVNTVGREMAEDLEWKDRIIKAPHFLRIDDFGDSAVIIKIYGDTKPSEQWSVAGELRKRIKVAFDKEGIEIPFPQAVIHQARL